MKLSIQTHGSKILSDLIEKLILDTTGIAFSYEYAYKKYPIIELDTEAQYINGISNRILPCGKVIDAATQMGELIALLEKKEIVIKSLATEEGGRKHDAVISEDGRSVKVGCSTVSFDKVEETYNAMKSIQEQ